MGMKKILIQCSLAILALCPGSSLLAQEKAPYKVGLFVPLFLDSAFDASGSYRFGKSFPRQSIPGLEFYEGAEFAMDSLRAEQASIDLHVFDIRSANGAIGTIARSPLIDSLDLIIGQVSGTDYLQLAQIAQEKQIPFVSATYPNDGGVKSNPQVIMVNAKLNTHIQTLYNYILRNWGTQQIVWVRRAGDADNRVEDVFKQLNQSPSGGVMKYKQLVLPDTYTAQDLQAKLDSLRDNLIIAGSLDENFGRRLLATCATLPKAYRMTIVGMPTWESIREITRSEYRHLPIVYTTTFFPHQPGQPWAAKFEEAYRKKTFSKPSDVAYKGYEITNYFVRLLMKYDSTLTEHLNDPSLKLITDYNFMPIRWSKTGTVPDYYENKRVYILRRLQGQVVPLN